MVVNQTDGQSIYPFTSHDMRIQGLRLHYVDEGGGDPVVMAHGNPTWSFYFRRLIKDLSTDHRVIAPDHMGCGLSEKPGIGHYDFRLKRRVQDFSEFMEKLNLNPPVTLVVHDWGGMIAMAWAVRHVRRVARIVVMNTAAFPPPKGKPLPLRLRILRNIPWLAKPAVLRGNLFCQGALHMAVRRPLSQAVKRGYTLPYGTPRHRLATLKFVEDIPLSPGDPGFRIVSDTAERLHRLSGKPILLLWGGKDFVFDKDYFNQWRSRFPSAEYRYFETAGHYVLEDRHHEILHAMRRFLKNHPIG